MIKSDLITAVNSQLTAIITQAKVRLASLQIINELFNVEVRELHEQILPDELVITEPEYASLFYDISFLKRGNTIFCNGYFRNKTGGIKTGTLLIIVDDVYKTKTNRSYFAVCSNGSFLEIQNKVITINEISNNEIAHFSLTYIIND